MSYPITNIYGNIRARKGHDMKPYQRFGIAMLLGMTAVFEIYQLGMTGEQVIVLLAITFVCAILAVAGD